MNDSVSLEISRLCDASRKAILLSLNARECDGKVIVLGTLTKVRQLVEQILEEGYVVVESNESPSTLAVLKEGDIEQLGLYLCRFCAMVFHDEVERNLHQRVHNFGFV